MLSAVEIGQTEAQITALEAKQSTLRANLNVGLLASTDQGSANTINALDPPVVPPTASE